MPTCKNKTAVLPPKKQKRNKKICWCEAQEFNSLVIHKSWKTQKRQNAAWFTATGKFFHLCWCANKVSVCSQDAAIITKIKEFCDDWLLGDCAATHSKAIKRQKVLQTRCQMFEIWNTCKNQFCIYLGAFLKATMQWYFVRENTEISTQL